MTERRKITIDLERELGVLAEDLINGPVVEVIARLRGVLNKVPEEYRDAVRLDVDIYSEDASAELTYERPETDEDVAKRDSLAARRRREQEAFERQQLAALKVKYERPGREQD